MEIERRLLFVVIPLLTFGVVYLIARGYAPFNIARVVGSWAVILLLMAFSDELLVDRPPLILLGAIAGAVMIQGHAAERQRLHDRLWGIESPAHEAR